MSRDSFLKVFNVLFAGVFLVFWVKFAYFGILLTRIEVIQQATTLLESQNLFVVKLMRQFLIEHTTTFSLILDLWKQVPLGIVVLGILGAVVPDKSRRIQNRIQIIAGITAQVVFLILMALIVNTAVTPDQGIYNAHLLGNGVLGIGLLFMSVSVYTLVKILYDTEVRGDGND